MASKCYCLFILSIYGLQMTFAAEKYHFCFKIQPSFRLEIVDTHLKWGKWINSYKDYAEIRGPSPGDVIAANEEKTICTSGRDSSTSGTEGFVEFKDKYNRRIIIKWDNPYWGDAYKLIDYDKKSFVLTDSTAGDEWYVIYRIDIRLPLTPQLSWDFINYTMPWSNMYYETCLKNSRKNRRPSGSNFDSANLKHKGITNADPGTIETVAGDFERALPTVNVLNSERESNPVYRYTTEFFSELNLNLTVVVRARIDKKVLDAVHLKHASETKKKVPQLTEILNKSHYNSYDVGILVGYQNGGPNEYYNFVPQCNRLRTDFKIMHENINKFVREQHGWVDMTIVVYYNWNSFMPVAFGLDLVYYFANGSLAGSCRDAIFWNERPPPLKPPKK